MATAFLMEYSLRPDGLGLTIFLKGIGDGETDRRKQHPIASIDQFSYSGRNTSPVRCIRRGPEKVNDGCRTLAKGEQGEFERKLDRIPSA